MGERLYEFKPRFASLEPGRSPTVARERPPIRSHRGRSFRSIFLTGIYDLTPLLQLQLPEHSISTTRDRFLLTRLNRNTLFSRIYFAIGILPLPAVFPLIPLRARTHPLA